MIIIIIYIYVLFYVFLIPYLKSKISILIFDFNPWWLANWRLTHWLVSQHFSMHSWSKPSFLAHLGTKRCGPRMIHLPTLVAWIGWKNWHLFQARNPKGFHKPWDCYQNIRRRFFIREILTIRLLQSQNNSFWNGGNKITYQTVV